MVLLTALPRSLSEYTATKLRGRGGFTHCVATQPVRIYSYKTEGRGGFTHCVAAQPVRIYSYKTEGEGWFYSLRCRAACQNIQLQN